LFGAILVGFWGYQLFRAKLPEQKAASLETGLWDDYVSTFCLTVINPMTVVAFAATFVTLQVVSPDNLMGTFYLIFGVFLGAELWWAILALGASIFRKSCTSPRRLQVVNQVSGVILIVIGVGALVSLI
jgi:threonine/homoserine/homoserine lactone efflux protein